MSACRLCPRRCACDRSAGEVGFCGAPAEILVARAAPHYFEEPPISGKNGSGTVFFSGCSLKCIFCQNAAISRAPVGRSYTVKGLSELFLRLSGSGVHNLNLVTATHYTDRVAEALSLVKPQLGIPVVWNSGGYELPETLRMLDGLVDIYLPDFKYASGELAGAYSAAPDYPAVAETALAEMFRQVGKPVFSADGLLKKGMVVRHLVLPGARADSLSVLKKLSAILPTGDVLLSLMRQYTPEFAPENAPAPLKRRLTSFEYESVLAAAGEMGFQGFSQQKGSATAAFTPDFKL